MTLYIAQGRGRGSSKKIWNPGDPGFPTHAESKDELLSSCPKPDLALCPAEKCDGTCYTYPRKELRTVRADYCQWQWVKMGLCLRCQHLRNNHRLTLAQLLAIWESQNHQCYLCLKELPDPRIIRHVRAGGRSAHIDHDHRICPKQGHSCEKCRRGLVCMPCNMHPLAITTIARGMWLLPEKTEDIDRWLKFLNLKERLILHDRLKLALESFPEER